MKTEELVARLQATPYLLGGSDWSGIDCWGLVEIWFAERHKIILSDRGKIAPGAAGVEKAFGSITDWVAVEAPRNDDLILMRHSSNGVIFEHGHVGVCWNGGVLHALDKKTGCVWQPLEHRIRQRFTKFLRHRDLA